MTEAPRAGWQEALVATLKATPGALEGNGNGHAADWRRIGGNALSSVWALRLGEAPSFGRYLGVADSLWLIEIARALRDGLGEAGRKAPNRELPDWLVRLAGRFDAGVRQLLPELGVSKHASSAKARELLGWAPRSREEALVASAEALLDLRVS